MYQKLLKNNIYRYPANLDCFKLNSSFDLSPESFFETVKKRVLVILRLSTNPGLLISGGLDSSILACIVKKYYPGIPCFTIAFNKDNEDLKAAIKFSREEKLNHYIYLLNRNELNSNYKIIKNDDNGCYLIALNFMSKLAKTVLATDGIDELMGGYWGHVRPDFLGLKSIRESFEYYWGCLEEKHLKPMWESAIRVGMNVNWVFLDDDIVNCASNISLEKRIENRVTKAYWKEVARIADVPEWIINRKKQGFCDAFK
jgi:asparagine synthetase B (glutamine-hydrolysing)